MGVFNRFRGIDEHSKAYDCLTRQMKATGREYGDGYDPRWWDGLTDAEKDQLEGKIVRKFATGDLYIGVYLPRLRHHDGAAQLAKALARSSSTDRRVFLAGLLFRETGDDRYLEVLQQCCIDERGMRLVAVELQGYPKSARVERILRGVFLASADGPTQLAAAEGILHQRGVIRDVHDYQECRAWQPQLKGLCVADAGQRRMLLDGLLASVQ